METARRTLHKLGPTREDTKNTIKYTTERLPAAVWFMVRQAVALFDRRFVITSGILAMLTEMPFFMLSALNLSDKVEDFSYGLGYIAVAIGTLLLKSTFHFRQLGKRLNFLIIAILFYFILSSFYHIFL